MKEKLFNYVKNNIYMFYYIISSAFLGFYLRCFTTGKVFYLRPLLIDLSITFVMSFFINLASKKTRRVLYFIFMLLSTALCFINALYYENYTNYASVSFISTAFQLERIESGSFLTLLDLLKIIYFIPITGYGFLLYKTKSFNQLKPKKNYFNLLIALFLILLSCIGLNKGSINKFLNTEKREYRVIHFGIYAYQIHDFVTSLEPDNFLIGYDHAKLKFLDYFKSDQEPEVNKYTDIFKDKNVLAIHAESIQTFLLDLKIGSQEVTPNLKKLADEGIFFSNFYSQESVGTSSDSEFTYSTSLLPATMGTVFINYNDREFVSMQKLLSQKGYYTFSMHGNNGDFWKRDIMHPNLGYQEFYDAATYKIDEIVGLGLSDKSFFKQSINKIKAIASQNERYYGTLIMLTNHTPFTSLGENNLVNLELTYKQNGQIVDHLENTKVGHYLESAHYADEAIGEFIENLDKEGLLDNTVIIIYGDHDAKLNKKAYDLLYNYDIKNKTLKESTDPTYINIDQNWIDINRKVPFIIWTKDKISNEKVDEITGMIDVLPTLGNMFGIYNKYQLGHDIFSVRDNIVVFPKGNWMTNKLYFDAQREEYYQIDDPSPVSLALIKKNNEYATKLIELSNDIIRYDLIKNATVK